VPTALKEFNLVEFLHLGGWTAEFFGAVVTFAALGGIVFSM